MNEAFRPIDEQTAKANEPLAVAAIGGLLSSTALSLLVVRLHLCRRA
jgi:Cu/Ag efflux pump CusA